MSIERNNVMRFLHFLDSRILDRLGGGYCIDLNAGCCNNCEFWHGVLRTFYYLSYNDVALYFVLSAILLYIAK